MSYEAATMIVQVQGQQSKPIKLRRGVRRVTSPKLFFRLTNYDYLLQNDLKDMYMTLD